MGVSSYIYIYEYIYIQNYVYVYPRSIYIFTYTYTHTYICIYDIDIYVYVAWSSAWNSSRSTSSCHHPQGATASLDALTTTPGCGTFIAGRVAVTQLPCGRATGPTARKHTCNTTPIRL